MLRFCGAPTQALITRKISVRVRLSDSIISRSGVEQMNDFNVSREDLIFRELEAIKYVLYRVSPSFLDLSPHLHAASLGKKDDGPKELNDMFEKLRATGEAAESGSLLGKHYGDVDRAIAKVVENLSPVYRASFFSKQSEGEIKAGEARHDELPTSAPVDRSSAETLQALVAQHKGPLRNMVKNDETRSILQGLFPSLEQGELEEMLSAMDRPEAMHVPVGKGVFDIHVTTT